MSATDNLVKHTSGNPLQKFFIGNFHRQVVDVVKRLPIESLLDAGCGEGFTLDLLEKAGLKASMKGVEIDAIAVKTANRLHPSLDITQGDFFDAGFTENFDMVMALEVLEHLENPDAALARLESLTRDYCLLSVPNEPVFMLIGYARFKTPKSIGHIQHWSPQAFKDFVARRFTVEAVYAPFPWTLILARKKKN